MSKISFILAMFLLTGVLTACGHYEEESAPYYLRPSEYQTAVEKCTAHSGLEGVGVIVPRKAGVKYQAHCKDGEKITWNK